MIDSTNLTSVDVSHSSSKSRMRYDAKSNKIGSLPTFLNVSRSGSYELNESPLRVFQSSLTEEVNSTGWFLYPHPRRVEKTNDLGPLLDRPGQIKIAWNSDKNFPKDFKYNIPANFLSHSSELKSFDEILKSFNKISQPFKEEISKRLKQLEEMVKEEGPDQKPISNASLMSLHKFILIHPRILYPSLVVTNSGNLRAEWKASGGRHFALEFIEDDFVKFVVFALDKFTKDQTIARFSGLSSSLDVLRLIQNYETKGWVFEK